MNNRFILAVLTATVLTATGGCAPFKNFFFGKGAGCGLCSRSTAPPQYPAPMAAPPRPACNQPTCIQPQYTQPQYTQPQYTQPQYTQPHYAPSGCGCNSDPGMSGYGPSASVGQTMSGYGSDPYCCPIGNGVEQGVIVDGQPIYGGVWQPAPTDSQGYRTNYAGYPDYGYKVDKNGDRIIYEEPLPKGARAVN